MRHDCLCRVEVHRLHKITRLIGADRNDAKRKGAISLTLVCKVWRVSRISSEIDGALTGLDNEGAPKRSHAIV